MRRLALLAFLFLTAPIAGGVEIASYEVTVRASEDGSGKGSAVVRLDHAVPGAVALPLGFSGVTGVELALGPEGTAISSSPLDGHTLVGILLPDGAPTSVELAFNFSVSELFTGGNGHPGERSQLPDESRLLGLRLMNSQPLPIRRYEGRLVFPEGMRAHAIREALPKLGKSEAGPRVQLCAVESKPGAKIRVDRLLQGETASMQVELVRSSRSPGWLIAGALLSILYLVYFRDLVSPRAE